MNVQHIRARLEGAFRPFELITSSGDRYLVPHPDFIFITQRSVVIADEDGFTKLLDPLHIATIEDVPNTGRTRGSKRSRKR